MLQFITVCPDKFTLVEQVRMVVDGGCRWVEISAPGMGREDLKTQLSEIVEICRELNVHIIMRDHMDLAAEMRLGGVFLDDPDPKNAASVRQQLGAEAIIGIAIDLKSANDKTLRQIVSADIDYAVVKLDTSESVGEAFALVAEAAKSQIKLPIVAQGDFDTEEVRTLIAGGFSGVALGRSLLNTPDPSATTHSYLEALSSAIG